MAHGRAEGAGLCQMLTTETQHSLSSKARTVRARELGRS